MKGLEVYTDAVFGILFWTNTAVSHPTSSTGPYQFTLAAPQSADGHVYALINELTLFLQHAIERVERPGGSHEGVGRKKIATQQAKPPENTEKPLRAVLDS